MLNSFYIRFVSMERSVTLPPPLCIEFTLWSWADVSYVPGPGRLIVSYSTLINHLSYIFIPSIEEPTTWGQTSISPNMLPFLQPIRVWHKVHLYGQSSEERSSLKHYPSIKKKRWMLRPFLCLWTVEWRKYWYFTVLLSFVKNCILNNVFPDMKLRSLVPNSCICVFIYLFPRSVLTAAK
jgi:hypothetical protein